MGTTVWTDEKVAVLVELYPTTANAVLVERLGISERTIQRKAKRLGIVKDADYIRQIAIDGLREIEYQRLCGRKMGPPKGLRCNPAGEFKKGHKEDKVTRARRVAAIRARVESEHHRIALGMEQQTKWKMKK